MLGKPKQDRIINSVEDLTTEELEKLLNDLRKHPCLPFDLEFIEDLCAEDEELKEELTKHKDKNGKALLSYNDILECLLADPKRIDSFKIQLFTIKVMTKRIRAECYKAFMIRPDDMTLDAWRALCESDYKESLAYGKQQDT